MCARGAIEPTLKIDLGPFIRANAMIATKINITAAEIIPWGVGYAAKWAMNSEKLPKPTKLQRKSAIKAGYKTKTDFKENDPGKHTKNVYINTHKKFGKTHLVIQHYGTGKTYYPTYSPGDFNPALQSVNRAGKAMAWTASTQDYVDRRIREYLSVYARILREDRKSQFLPKQSWYQIIVDLQRVFGVDPDLITPKAWKGGKSRIINATSHTGAIHKNGVAVQVGYDDEFAVKIINSYPSWSSRKMDKKFADGIRANVRKIDNDYKYGVFDNMKDVKKRYPFVKIYL